MTNIELFWEIPLSILSFIFSRILRFVMQTIGGYFTAQKNTKNIEWQFVSAEFLKKPIKLIWAMSRSRWNLHAIISLVGPIQVKEVISFDASAAKQSAQSWTLVVYSLPDFETITNISSLTVSGENQWESVSLKPGKYLLGLRYYYWSETVEQPTVKADGIKVVDAKLINAPTNINSFYRDLIKRKNWLHVWLNYYVFNLLRFKEWLPQAFVKKVFLPVPNPETKFYYGALKKGESIQFQLAPSLLTSHDIYYSLYSRECFPLDWYKINEAEHTTSRSDQKSIYIVRIHPKFELNAFFENSWVKIAVV
ncbi:MAG: hypothetical protein F6K65_14875 [Moorea sp. SIO3C2]|nr:hypothetical protein [Moorena sp. SIO3C2]